MKIAHPAYSYRDDRQVPKFDDSRPVIVFDGVCVLCHGFARFLAKRDTAEQFRFTYAQSALGQGLFRHYGFNAIEFETNLLIADGLAYGKLAAFSQITRRLGRPWSLIGHAIRPIPARLGDPAYDLIARNRYRLFGRHDVCALPDPSWAKRMIDHS
jgi:predicted DCC family thiol-disulfide oxidoreductase YuxK